MFFFCLVYSTYITDSRSQEYPFCSLYGSWLCVPQGLEKSLSLHIPSIRISRSTLFSNSLRPGPLSRSIHIRPVWETSCLKAFIMPSLSLVLGYQKNITTIMFTDVSTDKWLIASRTVSDSWIVLFRILRPSFMVGRPWWCMQLSPEPPSTSICFEKSLFWYFNAARSQYEHIKVKAGLKGTALTFKSLCFVLVLPQVPILLSVAHLWPLTEVILYML